MAHHHEGFIDVVFIVIGYKAEYVFRQGGGGEVVGVAEVGMAAAAAVDGWRGERLLYAPPCLSCARKYGGWMSEHVRGVRRAGQ